MSGIQTARGQQKFITPLKGYTAEESSDLMEYVTGQNVGGRKRAIDTVLTGLTALSTLNEVEIDSTQRIIKKTAHGARKNDVVQFTSGANAGISIQILSCPDANTMILAANAEESIVVGDEFDIKRYVTPQYDADGSLVVVAQNGPSQYVLDGVDTEVEEDTAVPANNRPFPSKLFIEIDGVTYSVKKDTGTPSNTVSVPVEITGASGPINITAGDINVQLTDLGANFDRTRIGNGTNQWEMNASGEGLVHDQDVLDLMTDALAELQAINASTASIDTKTPALGQALAAGSVPVVLTAAQEAALTPPAAITGFATEAKQDDQIVLLTDIETALGPLSLEATQLLVRAAVESMDTKTPALGQALAAASVPVVLTAAQLTTLTPPAAITGFATEVTLAALSAKIPASLGIKTAANSLSIAPASDAIFTTSQTPQGTLTFATDNPTNAGVTTFTVPAGAKRMVIANNAGATNADRVRVGNAAVAPDWGTETGFLLGVGSFTSELPAATVQIRAETATANVTIMYFY